MVVSAAGKVTAAGVKLDAAEQQLAGFEETVNYWKGRMSADCPGLPACGYDTQMYNAAWADYKNDYDTSYFPAYANWRTIFTDFQDNYLPKQKSLETKYGMNTGIGVGL